MKPIYLVAGLLALASPAHAGGFSFSVGGHRIHVEAPRHCRSTSCASVSISGNYDFRRSRDRFEDDDIAPAKPAAPAPQNVSPPAPPANIPPAPTVVVSAPPVTFKPAAAVTPVVAAPPPPLVQQVAIPAPPPPVQKVAIPLPPPPPVVAPQGSRVSQEVEQEAGTPVGDWQTGGKGAVRITRCGNALCGYILTSASNDRGEAVLVNMKPKDDAEWSGSVFSPDSGDTFYGTMNLRSPNTLRVEACALGRFYCSGNTWSRINVRAESLVTSRQIPNEPRS